MTFSKALVSILDGRSLTQEEAYEMMTQIMNGELTPVQIAAYLAGLRTKGEAVSELSGSAVAMRQAALQVRAPEGVVVDTCGTGGDGKDSFNISTAAAFVVAGAGFCVAKHGNRSVSSRSGSADVLAALGIEIERSPADVEMLLKQVGISFLFAPLFHPAMKHAAGVRKELGVRTIFNLLGPLTNPASPTVQIMGVFHEKWVHPIAEVLAGLGLDEGAVVHGQGYDEVISFGPTEVSEIVGGLVKRTVWTPKDFGLTGTVDTILPGGGPEKNATIFLSVLNGEASPYLDAVCMNAAAAIRAAYRKAKKGSPSLADAMAIAQEVVRKGEALKKFEALRSHSARKVA